MKVRESCRVRQRRLSSIAPILEGSCAVEPDERGKHPTADQYRNWGSVRAVVITLTVIGLILGGIIAWLILTGHHLAGSGRY